MITRQTRIGIIILGTVFLMLGMAVSAQTSEAAQPAAGNVQSWFVSCDNGANPKKLTCVMTQSLVQANSQQRIISARIQADAEGNMIMVVSLPHGLDLQSGIKVSIDEENPSEHPIQTADANGAYARVGLSPDMVEEMKIGSALGVQFTAASGNEVKFDLSLAGFFDAYTLLSN